MGNFEIECMSEINKKIEYDHKQNIWAFEWSHGPTHYHYDKIIYNMLKSIQDKKILDLGCGNGKFSLYCERNNNFVVSSDLSIISVKKTLSKRKAKLGVVSDIFRLPFKDKSFDVVILADIIEHIEDDRTAVSEVYRVLKKKGGIAVVMVPESMDLWTEKDVQAGHYRRYTKDELLSLFQLFMPRLISDIGYPSMRLYYRKIVVHYNPNKKVHRSLIVKMLSRLLMLVFYIDHLFKGNWKGTELFGIFEKTPGGFRR